jgi:hypothetical protein
LTSFPTTWSSPAQKPPEAANDDVVSAPGGFTYRAGIHQQGEPDWPPVEESEITLDALSGTVDIRYREYIETEAGETRKNQRSSFRISPHR